MRLITIILCILAFSCGSTASVPLNTSTVTGPPWDSFEEVERQDYVVNHRCVKATSAVDLIRSWPLINMSNNPDKVSRGRYVKAVKRPSTDVVALIQYRKEEGKEVVEIVALYLGNTVTPIVLLDYNILRAFKTGAASPGDVNALSLATGEYFCSYNINN